MWKQNPTSRLYFSEETQLAVWPFFERNEYQRDNYGRPLRPLIGMATSYAFEQDGWWVHEMIEYDFQNDFFQNSSQMWKHRRKGIDFLPCDEAGVPHILEYSPYFFSEKGLPDVVVERLDMLVKKLRA